MASINPEQTTLQTDGKCFLIVFGDADLDQAIKWSYTTIISHISQICIATFRNPIEENICERFVDLFEKQFKKVSKSGVPFKDDTLRGPQFRKVQYGKVLAYLYIASGKAGGSSYLSPRRRSIQRRRRKRFLGCSHRLHQCKRQHENRSRGDSRAFRCYILGQD